MAAPFLRPRGRRRGRCQGWGVTFGVGARLGASSTDPSSPCWDLWHRAGSVAAASVSPCVSKPAPLTKPEHPRRGLQGAMPRGRCLPAARRLQLPNFCSKAGTRAGSPRPRRPVSQAPVVQAQPCGLLTSDFPLCTHGGAAPSPRAGPAAGASLCQEPFVHSRSFQQARGAFGLSQAPPSCPQGSRKWPR